MKGNLYDLTMDLQGLLAKVFVINEKTTHNKLLRYKQLREQQVVTRYLGLYNNIIIYQNKLEDFYNERNYYKDNSITDKFFTGEIFEIRKIAIKSLKSLRRIEKETVDEEERQILRDDLDELLAAVNYYITIIRDFVQHDKKLQTNLLSKNIDFREKYQLINIKEV